MTDLASSRKKYFKNKCLAGGTILVFAGIIGHGGKGPIDMTSYFDKRRKQKLYQQWVEKSGLPPESVPAEPERTSDLEPMDDNGGMRRPGILTNVNLRLTMRHILYLLLIVAVLLVATASLATVLIMHSCG
jgi:hypothetical protein